MAIAIKLQSLWNPFRDWNSTLTAFNSAISRFKASETLLGIETVEETGKTFEMSMLQSLWNPFRDWNVCGGYYAVTRAVGMGFKASETLLGIETKQLADLTEQYNRFKASETLLGIETLLRNIHQSRLKSFKASETLLGIETCTDNFSDRYTTASKPLKPF